MNVQITNITLNQGETMTTTECALLSEFRHFLQRLKEERANDDVKMGMTRGSNETYPVTSDELQAEITYTIWQHLQAKHCPVHFQLGLLRAAVREATKECRTAKDCQYDCATDHEEVQFDLLKLQKFVVNSLEKLLTRLSDNTEAANLQNYAQEATLCAGGEKCQCESDTKSNETSHVAAQLKNKPRKMEDRHICLPRFSELYDLKQPQHNYSFYAVFDGHSGPLAASYAASQLPYRLAERLRHLNDATIEQYREALEFCYLQTDQMFARKRIFSGTTAVSALLAHGNPGHLYVAWVGDSKALLVSPSVSLQLVKAHKPDTLEERKRIESCDTGGTVMHVQGQWRVNGILNVARSIGDFSVNAVIAEPDFVDVELSGMHDYLVLGTDGLFDHVPEALIAQTVYNALADVACKIEDIPKMLIELAKQRDSQDNITVVIVLLKERAKIAEHFKANS